MSLIGSVAFEIILCTVLILSQWPTRLEAFQRGIHLSFFFLFYKNCDYFCGGNNPMYCSASSVLPRNFMGGGGQMSHLLKIFGTVPIKQGTNDEEIEKLMLIHGTMSH